MQALVGKVQQENMHAVLGRMREAAGLREEELRAEHAQAMEEMEMRHARAMAQQGKEEASQGEALEEQAVRDEYGVQEMQKMQVAREAELFAQEWRAKEEESRANEEEWMAKHNYRGLNEHRELHKGFIMRIQDFAREYNLDKESLNTEMLLFLKDWIINHILKEDRKYKEQPPVK